MPIYEYRCQDCNEQFEAMRSMNQADLPIECINCKGWHTKRLLSTFNAHGYSGPLTRSSGSCNLCSGNSCATCHP